MILAEGAVRQENLAVSSGSNEWPAPPPFVQQSREPLFRSFLRSICRSPRAEAQAQALSAIATPSQCSLIFSSVESILVVILVVILSVVFAII